jgi:hypothetical protein
MSRIDNVHNPRAFHTRCERGHAVAANPCWRWRRARHRQRQREPRCRQCDLLGSKAVKPKLLVVDAKHERTKARAAERSRRSRQRKRAEKTSVRFDANLGELADFLCAEGARSEWDPEDAETLGKQLAELIEVRSRYG